MAGMGWAWGCSEERSEKRSCHMSLVVREVLKLRTPQPDVDPPDRLTHIDAIIKAHALGLCPKSFWWAISELLAMCEALRTLLAHAAGWNDKVHELIRAITESQSQAWADAECAGMKKRRPPDRRPTAKYRRRQRLQGDKEFGNEVATQVKQSVTPMDISHFTGRLNR